MDFIWVPLQGEGGMRPKAPSVGAWQSPSYKGIDAWPSLPGQYIGLRCDGRVVIDCDDEEAFLRWFVIDPLAGTTKVRKTPRGFHFLYAATPGSPTGPAVGVWPHIDIRAGATSQIVYYAPGYSDLTACALRPFDPTWLPQDYGSKPIAHDDESWSEMPDGRGNNTMTAFAGAFRKQGMDGLTMARCLGAINKITMTQDPMPRDQIAEIVRSVMRYSSQPDITIELEEE